MNLSIILVHKQVGKQMVGCSLRKTRKVQRFSHAWEYSLLLYIWSDAVTTVTNHHGDGKTVLFSLRSEFGWAVLKYLGDGSWMVSMSVEYCISTNHHSHSKYKAVRQKCQTSQGGQVRDSPKASWSTSADKFRKQNKVMQSNWILK